MSTELLSVIQWLSPAFPLGSFAYSHGLETAISDGDVRTAADLRDWLEVVITRGAGLNDAVLFCAARRGEDVAAMARALAGSKERLEETEAQGAAFARTLRALGHEVRDAPLPVALARACHDFSAKNHVLLEVYLQSFASNLVQAAVRFVPLGQSEGQSVLADLAPAIVRTAEKAARADLRDLGSGAFFADLAALRHEGQAARVFKT